MSIVVIAVDGSKGKAYGRSSIILDTWLNRVTHNCWEGCLSQEGVGELTEELKGIATKNNSIQLFRVHLHDCRIIANIGHDPGRGKAWSPIGKNLKESERPEYKDYQRFVVDLSIAGGLMHDIGKATKETQKVYRGGNNKKELARHEVISAFWLDQHIGANGALTPLIEQVARKNITINWEKYIDWPDDPIKRIMFQVVLSHHGLPSGRKGDKWDKGCKIERVSEEKGKSVVISHHKDSGQPVFTPEWCEKLKSRLSDIGERGAELNVSDLCTDSDVVASAEQYYYMMSRILMMLGDASESAFESSDTMQKSKYGRVVYSSSKDEPLHDGGVYAKSARHVRLHAHLAGAADFARKAGYLVYLRKYPAITRRISAFDSLPKSDSPFYWQNKARYDIRSYNNKLDSEELGSIASRGFFGCVTSKTGVGKTRGCFGIMSALSGGQVRFTLALGYGVLAIQSGAEYREMGLTSEECAIAVGSKFQGALKEILEGIDNKGDKDDDQVLAEASARIAEIQAFEDSLVGGASSSHQTDIQSLLFNGKKKSRFLDTPIVSMTIDHVSGAMSPSRGSFLLAGLRLATSDLVIDEIDGFSENDLHGVGRLVYLAGLFGRKVLISSATVTPEISSGLYQMYLKGYESFRLASGAGSALVGFFNDHRATGYSEILDAENVSGDYAQAFKKFHSPLSDASCSLEGLVKKTVTRSSITKPATWSDFSLQVLEEATSLGDANHEVREGKSTSFGFVRVNRVKDAQRLGLALSEELGRLGGRFDGWTVRVQVLHGRMDGSEGSARKKIQSKFARYLDKKADSQFWKSFKGDHPALVSESDKILVILVATSVIDVGVDYDFDWGVIEAATLGSLIQICGRVWRHRFDALGEPGIKLLDFTLREAFNNEASIDGRSRFGFPNLVTGQLMPLSDIKLLDVKEGDADSELTQAIQKMDAGSVTDMFFGDVASGDNSLVIDNAIRLMDATVPADIIEREKSKCVFGRSKPLQLGHFIDDPYPMATNRYLLSFRSTQNEKKEAVFFVQKDSDGYFFSTRREKNAHGIWVGAIEGTGYFLLSGKDVESDDIAVISTRYKLPSNPGNRVKEDGWAYDPAVGLMQMKDIFALKKQ